MLLYELDKARLDVLSIVNHRFSSHESIIPARIESIPGCVSRTWETIMASAGGSAKKKVKTMS